MSKKTAAKKPVASKVSANKVAANKAKPAANKAKPVKKLAALAKPKLAGKSAAPKANASKANASKATMAKIGGPHKQPSKKPATKNAAPKPTVKKAAPAKSAAAQNAVTKISAKASAKPSAKAANLTGQKKQAPTMSMGALLKLAAHELKADAKKQSAEKSQAEKSQAGNKPQAASKPALVTPRPANSNRPETAVKAGAVKISAVKISPVKTGPVKPPARPDFAANEYVVYPTHGVGKIIGIEKQELYGEKIEMFVIEFAKEKMTLRVPFAKITAAGVRRLASPSVMKTALDTLKGRARIKRAMWSRRAQEYEAKINSGDPIAIAEVVRDLHRNANQPDQSYSERQIYEAALERLTREFAAIEKLDEEAASKKLEKYLQAA